MSTEENHKITLNVSQRAYPNKIPQEQVGDITFTTQTLSIRELENKVKEGYAFCYNFTKQSDVLLMKEKREKNFQYTNVIFFDFDYMTIPMQEFIQNLNYKPTFAFTSYSNAPEENDCRYRLVYVFSDTIESVNDFNKVYYGIASANGFKSETFIGNDGKKHNRGFDNRNVSQYYNGSKADCETYESFSVYSLNDFENHFVSYTDKFPFQNKDLEDVNTSYSQMENVPEISEEFRSDLKLLTHVDFMDKYMPLYEDTYVKSLTSELTPRDDGICFLYPDDYLEVKRNHWWKDRKNYIAKIKNGEQRRRKLYLTAKVMLHNVPDMTIEQLVYNLVRERAEYYDNSDGQLRKDVLIGIAESAFKYRNIPIQSKNKKKYKVNEEYWAAYGIKPNEAKNIIRGKLHEEEVLSVYDFSKSVKENLEILKALGIKVGKSYLYEFKKKYSDNDKNVSIDNIDNIPFQNKDLEDVNTSYSQMERLPIEKENRTISKEDEDFINSITIKDDFDDDDYDDSFEVDLFFRLRGL